MIESQVYNLPGETIVDIKTPTEKRWRTILGGLIHRNHQNGSLTEVEAKEVEKVLELVQNQVDLGEDEDHDVILAARGDGMYVYRGRWIAEHKGLVETSAIIAALGVATVGAVAILVRKGVILRKHSREDKMKY